MSSTTTWPTPTGNTNGVTSLVTQMYSGLSAADPTNATILQDNYNTYDSANAQALLDYAGGLGGDLSDVIYNLLYGSMGSVPGFDATNQPFG